MELRDTYWSHPTNRKICDINLLMQRIFFKFKIQYNAVYKNTLGNAWAYDHLMVLFKDLKCTNHYSIHFYWGGRVLFSCHSWILPCTEWCQGHAVIQTQHRMEAQYQYCNLYCPTKSLVKNLWKKIKNTHTNVNKKNYSWTFYITDRRLFQNSQWLWIQYNQKY